MVEGSAFGVVSSVTELAIDDLVSGVVAANATRSVPVFGVVTSATGVVEILDSGFVSSVTGLTLRELAFGMIVASAARSVPSELGFGVAANVE